MARRGVPMLRHAFLRQYLLPRRSDREMQQHSRSTFSTQLPHGIDLRRHRVQAFPATRAAAAALCGSAFRGPWLRTSLQYHQPTRRFARTAKHAFRGGKEP
ncbi:hypothetical protein KCP74_13555 [Salmonella enterica subsp. enterica]|nr:hypothetical protein KCP74_13555 [Salmonella enterica subsp. enterica]